MKLQINRSVNRHHFENHHHPMNKEREIYKDFILRLMHKTEIETNKTAQVDGNGYPFFHRKLLHTAP